MARLRKARTRLVCSCLAALAWSPSAMADRSSENMDPAYMFEKKQQFEEAALYYHRAVRGLREVYIAFHWDGDPAANAPGKYSTEYVALPKEMEQRYQKCLAEAALAPERVRRLEYLNTLWLGELVDEEKGGQRTGIAHIAPVAERLGDFRLAEQLRRGEARFYQVVAIPVHERAATMFEALGQKDQAAVHRLAIKACAGRIARAERMARGDKTLMKVRGFGGPSPWTGVAIFPAKVNPVAFQGLPGRLYPKDEAKAPPGPKAVTALLKDLAPTSEDPDLRFAAVNILAALGEKEMVVSALTDSAAEVREAAAEALAALHWADGWAACHRHADPKVQAAVAPLLAPAGKDLLARTWAITALLEGIGSSDKTKAFCQAALEGITGKKMAEGEWAAWWKSQGNARPGLLRKGPGVEPELDATLDFGAWWQSLYQRAPNPLMKYQPPAKIAWDGHLAVPRAGRYQFTARNVGEGRFGGNMVKTPGRMGFPGLYLPGPSITLTIDGKAVLPHPTDAVQDPNGIRLDFCEPMELAEGLHPIHVEFDYRSMPTGFWEPQPSVRLYWSSDQFPREIIPADRLLTKD